MKTIAIVIVSVGLVGCAAAPKPRELEAFEALRTAPNLEAAKRRAPKLVNESNQLFAKAREEWQSKDLDESRRDALMGDIKLKTALALVDQDQAKARMAVAARDQAVADEELGRVKKDLQAASEQVALMEKLKDAQSSQAKMTRQLLDEQVRATAQEKLSQAELALKTAETVEAANYAKAEYTAAADLIARAQSEMKAGNFSAAQTSAEMARQKAELAFTAARPAYSETQKNKDSKSRNDALARDVSSIGVTVKLERRGEVQRLVIPLSGMFVKKLTTISSGEGALDQIAQLIKKYPTYPVQIIGHTDNVGRATELIALSLARAQTVQFALLQRGVEASRMMVSGQGSNEPVTDNRSAAGRRQNNRIEVIFLFQ